MSCSKIYLPELVYEFMKYLENDYSTLYSCILVNRLWCRTAIPLLWENPFSIPMGNYNFIEIYLHNLNDDVKTKLSEYKIKNNLVFPSNTLFNYPSFLKYLNIWKIILSIERWIEDSVRILKFEGKSLDSVSNFGRLIQMSLFKMFIEKEVNLYTFDIEIFQYHTHKFYYNDIFELILQNPNFIRKVKNLKLSIGRSSIVMPNNHILQIINLHQNLKKISLSYNDFPLFQLLALSENHNYSNTLNTIILYRVNFKDITNVDKALEHLNVLESIHIVYCHSINTRFVQQIINLTKPFKLKSLLLMEMLLIETLQLLLQKSGSYLENFGYKFNLLDIKKQLFELVMKYCKNIKFLDLGEIDNQIIIHQVLSLIENIKQNLSYLSINVFNVHRLLCDNIECSSIILQNLGQILPPKLEYLNLSLHVNPSDFVTFLKNSQDIFISKLLIDNMMQESNITPYIKKYIMKEKRVKYLAVRYIKNNDLFCLDEEVKEFRLHNIIVRGYNDLSIDTYKFIKELD